MNNCISCIHSRIDGWAYKCIRVSVESTDPVTGHTEYSKTRRCSSERKESFIDRLINIDRCGPEGKYWKKPQ